MARDSDGLLTRFKRAFQSIFFTHVPDHPAHGGNTGDTEWSPRETAQADDPQRDGTADESDTASTSSETDN